MKPVEQLTVKHLSVFSEETATRITTDLPDSCRKPISNRGSQGSLSQYLVVFLEHSSSGEKCFRGESQRNTGCKTTELITKDVYTSALCTVIVNDYSSASFRTEARSEGYKIL